jgi:type I restriction enzyme M protein
MRVKLIESDLLECVLGLGPNLFYNSPMEACIVICRTMKPPERRGRVLFINAVDEVTRENAQSFLRLAHQDRIVAAYRAFEREPGFAAVADVGEVLQRGANLSIPLYVRKLRTSSDGEKETLVQAWDAFERDGLTFWRRMDELIGLLEDVVSESDRG